MRVIVAVDFGTSRSGYAFAYTQGESSVEVSDKKDLFFPINWPEQRVPYVKTLTQLLYSPEGELQAWGWPAVLQYAEACREASSELVIGTKKGERRTLADTIAGTMPSLIGGFKMRIHDGQRSAAGITFTDEVGRTFSVMRLVVDYLSGLREIILSRLRGGNQSILPDEEIRWCLTVPAIWSDADKQFMREAAKQAGFVRDTDDERLILVLEPEAAALACMENLKDAGSPLAVGERFMVVDAGGGTVDLTVHEVGVHGLKEVVEGSGAACGSTYIDRKFKDYLRSLFGSRTYQRLLREEPVVFQDMMNIWETGKCYFQGGGSRTINIPIQRSLDRLLSKEDPQFLERLAMRQNGNEDSIELASAEVEKLFKPVLDEVVAAVKHQFALLRRSGQRCDYLFLVGGFAESKVLQQRLRAEFGHMVRSVHEPPNPGRAIVHGAVLYGFDETKISRRVRFTYGCTMSDVFEEGVDPPEKRDWNDDRARFECRTRFSPFVQAGALVSFDERVARTYTVAKKMQSSLQFQFHTTTKKNARYTDEPEMKQIGDLTVSLPSPSNDLNRSIEVAMFFGKTEIRVEAKDVQSGQQARCTLQFERGSPQK